MKTMEAGARTQSRKELNKIYRDYILGAISFEGYDLEKEPVTDAEKLAEVCRTFYGEYLKNDKNWQRRYGSYQNAFKEWLTGLPSSINIDFENYKILELCRAWGVLAAYATEKQEDRILENWFNFMANKFFQLCRKEKINTYEIFKD